jgi:hypothetical protein
MHSEIFNPNEKTGEHLEKGEAVQRVLRFEMFDLHGKVGEDFEKGEAGRPGGWGVLCLEILDPLGKVG